MLNVIKLSALINDVYLIIFTDSKYIGRPIGLLHIIRNAYFLENLLNTKFKIKDKLHKKF